MKIDTQALESRISEATKLMGMLSQPVRLRILCILLDGEMSVLDLAGATGMSQPGISHHLKKLRSAALVKTRREAQTVYYSLHGNEVSEVMGTLHRLYCS